jgi:glycosyltransferase XagB
VARTKFSKFSTAGPDGPDTDTQKQVARTIRGPCANGGRWPYQNHHPHPVPGPSGDHSAESADNGSRMAATHRRVPRRVLIAVFTLALASATVLMAIRSTHFLYLLYIVVSLLVGMVALSTLVWMLNAWRTPHSLTESQLKADGRETVHSFSLIVPARHEEAVLEHTLSRLISSDHPDFEILVVVGHDDPGTREVAERMANRYPDLIKVVVDPSWPKSKPKALNAALSYCSGMITGVFDAEDDVHPALLRRVDQCFQATDSDIVQAGVQLMNFRSSWYTVHNVLEYYFWFRSRLHVHARQRFIPLGGNTVFIRTPILRTVGGWHDCLAEDCEIGVRLSTLGARTAVFYEPELVTREECPPTLGAFIKQRTRWNQGYLQTLARGYWWRLPLRQRVLGGYILGSPYVLALAWVMIPAAIVTAVAVNAPIVLTLISFLPLLPMFSMLVAQVVGLGEFCRLYRERRPSVRDYARLVLGLLVYQFILALAAARAVIREARGARGWDKTAHLGLHLDLNTDADAVAAEVTQPVPAVVDAHLAQRALAPSAVGSRQPAETESRALDSRAIVIAARPQGLNGYLDADLATTGQAGNGQASLPVRSVDHLFGENGAEPPVWAWLDEVEDPPTVPVPPVRRPRSRLAAIAEGGLGRIRDLAIRTAARRIDVILQIALIAVAALVVGTNLLHWPGIQFDEGTYMANAWALQHGRLANYTYSYGHPPLAWLLIFFWTEAGGILGHAMFSIDHGREFMLLVCLATCPLLYILARRLEFGRLAAASAVLLFALCPLGVFYHRAVLLDNPSIAFAIAAFALAWTPRRRLWAFVGSGACFALSVLCKETTLDLLPALCVAVFQNVDRRTRPYCLVLFLTSFLLTGGFYPLYAALKGELVPGRGHVSLMAYLMVQLVSRKGTGSVLNPHSQSNAIVTQWLVLDHWLLGLALALTLVALARRTTRAIALAFLIQVVTVFRPGYLPNMYVIGMIPFAALIVPGSIEAVWRWVRMPRFPVISWGLRAVLAGLACALVLVVAPRWTNGDREAMTGRQDGVDRAAAQWVVHHVPRDKRVIVDDEFWIYLIEHGYNDQPMRGGFFSKTVISYWPLDYDPAVRRTFPHGWRDFRYIVVTQAIVDTLTNTPTAAAAINHSRIIASFGRGVHTVQVREIIANGR